MRLRYERVVDANPDAAWRVVSDVEAYADAAPSLTVRTQTYPLPLRAALSEMRGRWEIEPVAAGARIVMTFDARPRFGPLGGLMLRLGRRRFDTECRSILDHWQRRLTERDVGAVT